MNDARSNIDISSASAPRSVAGDRSAHPGPGTAGPVGRTGKREAGREDSASEFEVRIRALYEEARKLLIDKNKAYGPTNISLAPPAGQPINGLLVRMHDKQARMQHMYYHGGVDVVGERMRETALDLANYALILCAVLDGTWDLNRKESGS